MAIGPVVVSAVLDGGGGQVLVVVQSLAGQAADARARERRVAVGAGAMRRSPGPRRRTNIAVRYHTDRTTTCWTRSPASRRPPPGIRPRTSQLPVRSVAAQQVGRGVIPASSAAATTSKSAAAGETFAGRQRSQEA